MRFQIPLRGAAIAWLIAVFLVAFVLTPSSRPCAGGNCNYGIEIPGEGWCWPSGGCEYPDYCRYASCSANNCQGTTWGWIRFCVAADYCWYYPPCNAGCCGT